MRLVLYHSLLGKTGGEDCLAENTGELMTKAISDIDICTEGVRKFATELFDTGVVLIAYIAFLRAYDIRLTFISCAFIPLPFSYYTAHSSGEISSHFLNDVDAINVLFTEGIVALSANALKLLAIMLVIGRTNVYLALLLCVILPFLWTFTRICQQSVRKAQLKQRSAIADVFSCLLETIAMLPVIQNLGMESFMETGMNR